MEFPELIESLFSAETMPEGARDQIMESFNFHNDLNAEKVLGLETANGDAMANLARVEEERDGLQAQLAAVQTELANVKAGEFDKLMNGGDGGTPDDGIAEEPEVFDPDITPDDLINEYTTKD